MAASISEIRKESSAGQIVIKLTLAADEISAPQEPPPLYFSVPRLSYLPRVADAALDAFRHVLSPLALAAPRRASSSGGVGGGSGGGGGGAKRDEERAAAAAAAGGGGGESSSSSSTSTSPAAPWFSETGDPSSTPLRWHYPVGVLADAAVAREGGKGGRGNDGGSGGGGGTFSSSSSPSTSSAPWPLTIHFSRYPSSVLPPWRVSASSSSSSSSVAAAAAAAAAATTAAATAGDERKHCSSSSASASSSSSLAAAAAVREAFFNSLKEASCAAVGSASRVLSMPGVAAERLWRAAESGDAEGASAVVSQRGLFGESEGGGHKGAESAVPPPPPPPFVPLRLVVVAPSAGETLSDPDCRFEVVCTSRPVAAAAAAAAATRKKGEEGEKEEEEEEKEKEKTMTTTATTAAAATRAVSLGEALLGALPAAKAWTLEEHSSSSSQSAVSLCLRGKPARVLVAGLDVSSPSSSSSDNDDRGPNSSNSSNNSLLSAPVSWAHARLSACDQFLYVVVRAPEPL